MQVGCLRVKRPRTEDPGADFMESNRGRDRMDLRSSDATSSNQLPAPPTAPRPRAPRQQQRTGGKGTGNGRSTPRVPVVIGHHHEEAPREESDEGEGPAQANTALRCPFPECPDSLVEKTRKALVSHIAARHVSHGQVAGLAHRRTIRKKKRSYKNERKRRSEN